MSSVSHIAIAVVSWACILSGLAFWIFGQVKLMVIIWRHGVLWFLGCLLIPPVCWIFIVIHLKETWKPFAVSLAGLLVLVVGVSLNGNQPGL